MSNSNSGNSMPEMPRKNTNKKEISNEELKQLVEQKQTTSTEGQKQANPPKTPQVPNKKPVTKKRPKKDYTMQNIILCVLALLGEIGIVITMLNTTQFSSVGKNIFIIINVIVLLLVLVLNLSLILAIRTHKKPLYVVSIIFICLFVVVGSYGTYAVTKVNSNISKMTGTTTTESVSTSLIVYDEDGNQTITDVSQLEGKTVGYATGTNTATLGQNQIDSRNLNVSYEEYQDYSSLILALFDGSIDCAILPTNYESIFQSETSLADLIANTASILDFEDKVTIQNQTGSDKDITSEPFTVLLIGTADGLSDTMILCSVNPISMKVTMSSIARDSYVPITCYNGGSSKLNAARAVSVDCLISTIEDLVGVDIDYYVDTNFQGVVDIVDALGGIVVDSPIAFVGQNASSERGHYTVYVPAGEQVTLDGEQALAFARERHLFATGDFARQEHQQEVISAIVQKIMRTRDVNTFLNVLQAAGDNIQTNFTLDQMTSFVSYAMQKANRYYDSAHIENILDIQSSRVTGYSSSKWDEGLQLALYIYRVWQGSLTDTRNAIERNINLDSAITADTSRIKWSVNWEFTKPSISADVYNETMIAADTPPQASCGENETLSEDGSCVAIATPEPTTEATPTPTTEIEVPTIEPIVVPTPTPTQEATPVTCGEGYHVNADGTGCEANPTATPEPTPEPTPTPVTCGEGYHVNADGTGCEADPTPTEDQSNQNSNGGDQTTEASNEASPTSDGGEEG